MPRRNDPSLHELFLHFLEDRFGGCDNPREAWKKAVQENEGYNPHNFEVGVPLRVRRACWNATVAACKKLSERDAVYKRRVEQWKLHREEAQQRAAVDAATTKLVIKTAGDNGLQVIDEPEIVEPKDIPESWEDECDKPPIAKAQSDPKVTRAVAITYNDEPTQFSVPHGHDVLAASRLYGDTELRAKGAGAAMSIASQHPHAKAAVVDVGSGATGIKATKHFLETFRGVEAIYFHCMFPTMSMADLDRENTIKGIWASINWVDSGNPPVKGMINACRHRAKDCDCLRHYTFRYIMSVHSTYYFDLEDWRNLFRYSDTVHTFQHVPRRLNTPVPLAKPEFVWTNVSTSKTASAHERRKARLRQAVLGEDDTVVFEPLTSHGTTYVHKNPLVDLERGGFQMPGAVARKIDALSHNMTALFVAHALSIGGAAQAAYMAANALARRDIRGLGYAVLTYIATSLPTWGMRSVQALKNRGTPTACTEATVRVVNGSAVVYQGEELAHFYSYAIGPVGELEPRVVTAFRPDMKAATELASVALVSKKSPAAIKAVLSAKVLRDGLSEATAQDTVDAAIEIAKRIVEPKNDQATSSNVSLPPQGTEVCRSAWAPLASKWRMMSKSHFMTALLLWCMGVGTSAIVKELFPSTTHLQRGALAAIAGFIVRLREKNLGLPSLGGPSQMVSPLAIVPPTL